MRIRPHICRAHQRQFDLDQRLAVMQHDGGHADALEGASCALEDESLGIDAHIGAEPRSPECHGHLRERTRGG